MTHALAIHALSRFLRVETAEAMAIAALASDARADFKRLLGQQARSQRLREDATSLGLPPRGDGPSVIALAFSQRSLFWLQRLSLSRARPVRVLRTELSEPHFREHARSYGQLELLTAIEMIRHGSGPGDDTAFITFPDHTVSNGNTNVQVPLFGEAMLFQTLESLLARKHHAALYRYDGERLERWAFEPIPAGGAEHSLIAEATWLAAGVERAIASAPSEYFGWDRIARKCPRSMQGMHRMHLEVLKGFLRSWAAQAEGTEFLEEILALIEREGLGVADAEANAGLRLAGA